MGRPVVRVNGAVLTDRDLLREMFTIFPYARLHNGFPKAMEADIRDGAMKMMIFEELVYQEAKRRNMTVPPGATGARHGGVPPAVYIPRRNISSSSKESSSGSQPSCCKTKVERSLLIDKFLKQEVTDKAAVSVAEAKAYYDQHPERFRIPESFSFQSISILPPPNATAAQLQGSAQAR